MKATVTVTISDGDGDLKTAEFVGRFRGYYDVAAKEAAQFVQRSIERAKPEPGETVRLTEVEEDDSDLRD